VHALDVLLVIHSLESYFWHWPLYSDRGDMQALT
jgi:hypothetical protein